jgi:hypothetical protein
VGLRPPRSFHILILVFLDEVVIKEFALDELLPP